MRAESRRLANVLFAHRTAILLAHPLRKRVNPYRYGITYGELCDRAGLPELTRSVGNFLVEVADWCTANGWPPLNSLAVNGDSRGPGDGYDLAPGCSLLSWPGDVEKCLRFGGYPASVP